MRIFIVYLIFVVSFVYLTKISGGRKLTITSYVPLCWMVLILSRTLSQWLQLRRNFGPMEAEMEGSPVDRVFLFGLIFLGLWILHSRNLDASGAIRDNKALFLFYAFALLSLLWADFPLIAFKRWVRWFGSLTMVLVILSEEDPKAAINSLMKRITYALIPLSIIFIKFVPSLGRSYSAGGGANYHGVGTHKNQYGMLLLICGFYLAWEVVALWRKKDVRALRKVGIINSIFIGMIFWQLFFIDSKTPIICLLAGISVLIWLNLPFFQKNPGRARVYIIVFAILMVFLQTFVEIDITGAVISSAGRDPTLTDRTLLWADILEVPFNRWVGTGWDNFWLGDRVIPLWEKWLWSPRSAHNGYLEIFLYLGWAGIILLSLTLLAGYKKSSHLLATDLETGCLSFAFVLITLLYNYSESAFHRTNPIWFFALLFSLLSIRRKEKAEPGLLISKEAIINISAEH